METRPFSPSGAPTKENHGKWARFISRDRVGRSLVSGKKKAIENSGRYHLLWP
jgi:hypothetical protein